LSSTDSELTKLRNIGPTTARRLNAIGIFTLEDLRDVGVIEAYRRVRTVFPERTTLVLVYALQGTLMELHWNDIPEDVRAELIEQAAAI
jgi:DNA transformation protein and related proteins